ncbi:MAG: hypothetical protein PHI98_13465 [Eubacteriales bacterium]|nr:hypothetical protein [Eubacteriales bacterium]
MKRLLEGKFLIWLAVGLMALVGVMALSQSGGGETMSTEEKRIAEVLGAIYGAGKVDVALFYPKEKESGAMPTGAVVVAQGADDLAVRLTLIRAVRTLLSLPEAAVDVFVMEDGR